jgi:hypothetical protein
MTRKIYLLVLTLIYYGQAMPQHNQYWAQNEIPETDRNFERTSQLYSNEFTPFQSSNHFTDLSSSMHNSGTFQNHGQSGHGGHGTSMHNSGTFQNHGQSGHGGHGTSMHNSRTFQNHGQSGHGGHGTSMHNSGTFQNHGQSGHGGHGTSAIGNAWRHVVNSFNNPTWKDYSKYH